MDANQRRPPAGDTSSHDAHVYLVGWLCSTMSDRQLEHLAENVFRIGDARRCDAAAILWDVLEDRHRD
jgi:hypothetical protein